MSFFPAEWPAAGPRALPERLWPLLEVDPAQLVTPAPLITAESADENPNVCSAGASCSGRLPDVLGGRGERHGRPRAREGTCCTLLQAVVAPDSLPSDPRSQLHAPHLVLQMAPRRRAASPAAAPPTPRHNIKMRRTVSPARTFASNYMPGSNGALGKPSVRPPCETP